MGLDPGLSALSKFLEAGVLTALAGVGGAALNAAATRRAAAAKEPADMIRAAAELSEKMSEGGGELLEEFRREFRFLRTRSVELQQQLDKANGRIAELQLEVDAAKRAAITAQDKHNRCEATVEELRAEITKLMSGPIAGYAPTLINGVLPPKT